MSEPVSDSNNVSPLAVSNGPESDLGALNALDATEPDTCVQLEPTGEQDIPVAVGELQEGQSIAIEKAEATTLTVEATNITNDLKNIQAETPPLLPSSTSQQRRPKWLKRLRTKKQRILAATLLIGILVPTILAVSYGVRGYATYAKVHDQAYSGLNHLLTIKKIFTGANTHFSGLLDTNKLHQAQKELSAAQDNFQQVQHTLTQSDFIGMIDTYLPQYRNELTSVQVASGMAQDVTEIGQELVQTALVLAPSFRGPLLSDTHAPLLTPGMLTLIGTTIDTILPHVQHIQMQSHHLTLDALPISADKRGQLTQLLQYLPQATTDLTQMRGLVGAADWLLGVSAPRTFLVQTMDRAELRPTGGFTGQYGELSIIGGRLQPFVLKDISGVEYIDNSQTYGQMAPSQYRSRWPFAN
ncbi:MAG: DUF4012 domain-containing protein, partial [Chloroflexota bacterium]|nr:DUF4012 domain-containing protein [Chloroflexota bacterium]